MKLEPRNYRDIPLRVAECVLILTFLGFLSTVCYALLPPAPKATMQVVAGPGQLAEAVKADRINECRAALALNLRMMSRAEQARVTTPMLKHAFDNCLKTQQVVI